MTGVDELATAARSGSPDLVRLALTVVQPGFEGRTAPDWLLRRLDRGLGGVALFARNIATPDQVVALTAAIHGANPQALVAVDEEGGDVTRVQHATGSSWPGNLALGAVDDPDLTRRVAREIGTMLDHLGIDLDYAPDADVNVEAANPVIGVRSFGSDAELVARHTAAWVAGLQAAGVLACAKHFPGHGDTGVDSHLEVPTVSLGDPSTSPWLVPFRAAVAAGVASVMSAHVRVPSLHASPATLAEPVMTGLLRGELGFSGLALSDGMEMGAITGTLGLPEGCVRALAAGVDALCIGGGLADEATLDAVVSEVVAAVVDGRLAEQRLAQAAGRVTSAAALRADLRTAARASSGGTVPSVTTGAGLEAAARAVQVRGAPVASTESPLLVVLAAPRNIAVGDDTPVGLVTAAARRWADAAVVTLSGAGAVERTLAAATGRPVWVVVRDPHRHPWMDELLGVVAAVRPDATVVDTGWPGWTPPPPLAHVVTRGASWAGGEAVVDLLSGRTTTVTAG